MDDITLQLQTSELPADMLPLTHHCKEIARSIVERRPDQARIPHYQPADGLIAWHLLRAVHEQCLTAKQGIFCEWGSGIGHVTLMASMLGMNATGIEIEPELVDIARNIARHFDIQADFKVASMYPQDNRTQVIDYLSVDLFFTYPWPSEKQRTIELFEQVAKTGAILVCYSGGLQYRILRKWNT